MYEPIYLTPSSGFNIESYFDNDPLTTINNIGDSSQIDHLRDNPSFQSGDVRAANNPNTQFTDFNESLDTTARTNGKVKDFFNEFFETLGQAGQGQPSAQEEQNLQSGQSSFEPSEESTKEYGAAALSIYNYVKSGGVLELKDPSRHTDEESDAVRTLQALIGLPTSEIDGVYGKATAKQLGMYLSSMGPINKVDARVAQSILDKNTLVVRSSGKSSAKVPVTSKQGSSSRDMIYKMLTEGALQTYSKADSLAQAEAERRAAAEAEAAALRSQNAFNTSASSGSFGGLPLGVIAGGAAAIVVVGLGFYLLAKKD